MGLGGGLDDLHDLVDAPRTAPQATTATPPALYDPRRRPVARDEIMVQADAARRRMREGDGRRLAELAGFPSLAATNLAGTMGTSSRQVAAIC